MEAAVPRIVPEIHPITDAEFQQFQTLIQREAGIFLSDVKRALLVGRLVRRLRELGFNSFGKYYRYVREHGEKELRLLLDAVSTNETHFFREPVHFEYLRNRLLPAWMASVAESRGSRQLRIWSAACSSGEEPYSIAMTVLDAFRDTQGFTFEVIASDISTRVLAKAQAGVYPIEKAEETPEAYRKAYMLKGQRESAGSMKVRPELRACVSFQRANLVGEMHEVTGSFDAIFCRNVLIYFQVETRRRVLAALAARLRPGGHLFLGHAETMHGADVRTSCPVPNVYLCNPASNAPAGSK